MQSPSRWLGHTSMTDPGAHKAQIERFPGDVASLGRIVQGLLVHSEWLDAARTLDGLWRVIGESLDAFTPQECANYFEAAGYDAW